MMKKIEMDGKLLEIDEEKQTGVLWFTIGYPWMDAEVSTEFSYEDLKLLRDGLSAILGED